ncbi:uncharacterized protein J3R85_019949 [Psidium guajava]|nr:uncharacterized protein J3R85_019949 [Psidium guajava]
MVMCVIASELPTEVEPSDDETNRTSFTASSFKFDREMITKPALMHRHVKCL